jgi:hypothetical protein
LPPPVAQVPALTPPLTIVEPQPGEPANAEPAATHTPDTTPAPEDHARKGGAEVAFAPPADTATPNISNAGRITSYIDAYDGGDCVFVTPLAVGDSSASIEGYGSSLAPFETLDAAFKRTMGFEADIGVRQVTPPQCPAVTFLNRTRHIGVSKLRLDIEPSQLRAGQLLSGTVGAAGSRVLALLLVHHDGVVDNLSKLLKSADAAQSFKLRVEPGGEESQPGLLILIASASALAALKSSEPVTADKLFPALTAEAVRPGTAVSATVKYIKLIDSNPEAAATTLTNAPSSLKSASAAPTVAMSEKPAFSAAQSASPHLTAVSPDASESGPAAPLVQSQATSAPTPAPAASGSGLAPRLAAALPPTLTPVAPSPPPVAQVPALTRPPTTVEPQPGEPADAEPSATQTPDATPAPENHAGKGRTELALAPPADTVTPNISNAGRITNYIDAYDGGDCFFITPLAVGDISASIEGYGSSLAPFETLDDAFKRTMGFEADIGVRQVTPPQCPAVTFLNRTRRTGVSKPRLDIEPNQPRVGQLLSGTVGAAGSRELALLLVHHDGVVDNLSKLLKSAAAVQSFKLRVEHGGEGSQPELLILIASASPLTALKSSEPVTADKLFPALTAEAVRLGTAVSATAKYIKLVDPNPAAAATHDRVVPAPSMSTAQTAPERLPGQAAAATPTNAPSRMQAASAPPMVAASEKPAVSAAQPASPHLTSMSPDASAAPSPAPLVQPPAASAPTPAPSASGSAPAPRLAAALAPTLTPAAPSPSPVAPVSALTRPPTTVEPQPGLPTSAVSSAAQTAAPMPEDHADQGATNLAFAPPAHPAIPNISNAVRVTSYIDAYDGGDCFFVTPVTVSDTRASIEGFGSSVAPFEILDDAFKRTMGFEADIGVRQVTPAQCPAITFLNRSRGERDSKLRLDIEPSHLHAGQLLNGTIDATGSGGLALLLVHHDGIVDNLSKLLERAGAATSFTLHVEHGGDGSLPELVILIAGTSPLTALKSGEPLTADKLFPALTAEATRSGTTVSATAKYFKLDP